MTELFPELAGEVIRACRAKGLRLATAESCTGGLVCGALTAIPGSSDVVECAYVVYSYAAKSLMLDIPAEMLREHGAVSLAVAAAMADNAIAASGCDLAVSVTGVAGPGGSENKPAGMVCFGIASKAGNTVTELVEFGDIGRENVRVGSIRKALELLLAATTG